MEIRALAALAALNDLKRSNSIFAKMKKGKLQARAMKSPSRNPIRSRIMVRMNGLGEAVNIEVLVREAEVACRFLKAGHHGFTSKDWNAAVENYFKASAVATNVVFTSKVHGVKLPQTVIADMNCVIAEGTHGIKMVMKVVAAKSMLHHEKGMHKGKKSIAAPYMRKLMKGRAR